MTREPHSLGEREQLIEERELDRRWLDDELRGERDRWSNSIYADDRHSYSDLVGRQY